MANQFCKEPEKIENYEKAKSENFVRWNCHHRLETHNSDGIKRLVSISRQELMALGVYFDRPPEELIYLTVSEHTSIHSSTRHRTEEQKQKISNTLKGHQVSADVRKKISNKLKGQYIPEEVRRKISNTMKGGNSTSFKKGHKMSKETIMKMSESKKKLMAFKAKCYENYKDKMTWNQFQTFFRLNRRKFEAGSNVI